MKHINEIENMLKSYIEEGAFPGCCYALVTLDDVYINSLGNKALFPSVEKNNIDTLYDLASLTKVISTLTAILTLHDQGLLKFSDKVCDYLPRFKHKSLTLLHLLNHTSGLPAGVYGVKNMKTKEDVVNAIYDAELIYETESKIVYSCVNFMVLGFIVEAISGKSLDKFMAPIFAKMEMTDTGYNPKDTLRCAPTEERNDDICKGIVRGYVHDETAYLLGGVSGNAGLFSTISDLTKFIKMYLNYGTYNGEEIIKKSTIDEILGYSVKYENTENNTSYVRTIGWLIAGHNEPIGQYASSKTIHHTGFTGTNMWIDLERGVGFCLLTNRVHPTRQNFLLMKRRKELADYINSNDCFE